jgi:hypothetical protein
MPAEDVPMLDRVARRAAAAAEHFVGCRRVEVHVDGVEWTIGHDAERVLLALADDEPVALTADEASELAAALLVRAGKIR